MAVPGKRINTNVNGNADKPAHVCVPCRSDNVNTTSRGLCKECREYMCNTCFRHHLKAKACRHHTMVDACLSSLPFPGREEGIVECEKHNGEALRVYCRNHELVGCGDCMIPDHNTCKPKSINNLSKKFQESDDFRNLVSTIDKLRSEKKKNENTVKENKRKNKTMIDKALGDIRNCRLDMNTYFDKIEADIIYEAKHIMLENEKILTELEKDLEIFSSKVEEMKQMLNTEIYQDNVLFINTIEFKPKLSKMKQALTKMKLKDIKFFEFVCDEQMQSLITSAKQLGTLTMSTTVPRSQFSQMTETKPETSVNSECRNADETVPTVKEVSPVRKVSAGARVCHNNCSWFETGTVTAVHPDGEVNVMWNDRETGGPYTVRIGYEDVSLTES